MKFNLKQFIVPHFWKKFILMVVAIFFMGFFLSFLIDISWGTDPCTYQNKNASDFFRAHFGNFWTFGNFNLILNCVCLLFVIFTNWKLIGFGTLFNMTMIGYTADFFRSIWSKTNLITIYQDTSYIGIKITIFILAITGFVITASIYMNADMGLSPYDAISFILADKLKKFIPFSVFRILYDSFVIIIGLIFCLLNNAFSLTAMIGSIVMAFTLGPCITQTGKLLKKLLFNDE